MTGMPKFTKTPPEIVAAFEAAQPARPDVKRKTMFGYPAYFTRGNMFAFTFGPKIAVRLDDAARTRARRAGATAFEVMPGRPMTEYVAVPPSAMKGAALRKWVADALTYADTLPTKAGKSATKAAVGPASKTAVAKKTTVKKIAAKKR